MLYRVLMFFWLKLIIGGCLRRAQGRRDSVFVKELFELVGLSFVASQLSLSEKLNIYWQLIACFIDYFLCCMKISGSVFF